MKKLFPYLLLVVLAACVTVSKIEITDIDPTDTDEQIIVTTRVKAHLKDGSTVMYPEGMMVHGGKILGKGTKYDLSLEETIEVTEVAVDDVAAMESYQDVVNEGASAAATTVTTVGGGVAAVGLLKLMFGSCPTTYTYENGEAVLEAESFSYSIAPGFEARDVDRLGIHSDDNGYVELEVRNEALETHYINHVELLEVAHAAHETVFPDTRGEPVVFGTLREATSVTDRNGSDIRRAVTAADKNAWGATEGRLNQVTIDDMGDFLEAEFPVTAADGQLALVLRLRNSLLNTVLLYDVMLDGQGYKALDWMGGDLTKVWSRYELASWYQEEMGMRVEVWDRGRYREVTSVADTGPIAWHDLAIPLPHTSEDKVKVRLSFITDNWRIDQVALGTNARTDNAKTVALSEVVTAEKESHPAAQQNLSKADATYLVTKPGEYVTLRFDVGQSGNDEVRTWFFAAEGYYIEWMRAHWLEESSKDTFEPGDEALMAALTLWGQKRDGLREQFESTMIPVR